MLPGPQPAQRSARHGALHAPREGDAIGRVCHLQALSSTTYRAHSWPALGHQDRGEAHLAGEGPLVDERDVQLLLRGHGQLLRGLRHHPAVRASQNQSSVTCAATVSARATARQDPVPSSPTGTVSFLDGIAPVCTVTLIRSDGYLGGHLWTGHRRLGRCGPSHRRLRELRRQLHHLLGRGVVTQRRLSRRLATDPAPTRDVVPANESAINRSARRPRQRVI